MCINAINISHDFHFCSDRNQKEWFQFHIPNIRLFITHYSIQVPERDKPGWYYPVAWDLYGISNKNENPSFKYRIYFN